jgi:hypothetical protein
MDGVPIRFLKIILPYILPYFIHFTFLMEDIEDNTTRQEQRSGFAIRLPTYKYTTGYFEGA